MLGIFICIFTLVYVHVKLSNLSEDLSALTSKNFSLNEKIARMEKECVRFEEGFKNKTTKFCTKNDIEKLSSDFFTKQDAVVLFDKAVGAVRERIENLEDEFLELQGELTLKSEHFLTKETVQDIFIEYQERVVEEYKNMKDKRWDRLSEALSRK